MSEEDAAAVIEEKNRLVRENWALRAALGPFAAVAKGIPDNWPGGVLLCWDYQTDHAGRPRACLNYFGLGTDASAPPIAAYRRAAELLKDGVK